MSVDPTTGNPADIWAHGYARGKEDGAAALTKAQFERDTWQEHGKLCEQASIAKHAIVARLRDALTRIENESSETAIIAIATDALGRI